jgi:DNA-binding XRE family transcriptional regulator
MQRARIELANEMAEVAPPSLSQLRLKCGMSQADLAMKLSTSQSHIAKIEAGKVELYLRTAIKLADTFEISLDQLRSIVEVIPSNEPMQPITIVGKL